MDEYLQNKILGAIVLAYTCIMTGLYLFMAVFNLYESKLVMVITMCIIILLYFIGIVELDSEYFERAYRDTNKVRS